jgi:lysophospholipase L1-like esterase
MLPRICALFLGLLSAATALAVPSGTSQVPATDSRFLYEGRFDRANPQQPVVTWSGSRISLDFDGAALALLFGAVKDQAVFNVTVDGATEIADLKSAKDARYVWPHPLGAGRHHLEVFKRSEAAKGHAAFAGLELAAGAQAWAPPPPAYQAKFEFFGDSITAGACNEDGAKDQWDDFRTHNHALSYAYLTSEAMSADHRAVAVSGMGIRIGYVGVLAGQAWDKLYPRADSPRADLAAWQPDVAFVNFGENDDSFTKGHNLPFPPDWVPGYVALVRNIRAAYPQAQIVLLRGGMTGGAKSERLRPAWEAAVRELEAGDAHVAHFVFTHYSKLHPRVSDDRIMAAELVAWLQAQPWMAAKNAK